jgi:hypothetical protein
VLELDDPLAKALGDGIDGGAVVLEPVVPPIDGILRDAECGPVDLARPLAAVESELAPWKGGEDRPPATDPISLVEVIHGTATVEQHGGLEEALPDHLGDEVDVLLGAVDANGDVVQALDGSADL